MSAESAEIARGVRIELPPLAERGAGRRTPDERLLIRFPALYRALAHGLSRLRPGSRLRRRLLARSIGRAYAAANRRDFDLVLAGWDLERETEYRPGPDLLAPDQETVFRGREGYLRMWGNWLDAFDDLRFEPEELLDMGDKVLVTAQQRAHGSGSGVAVSKPVFQLFQLRRGLVVWQHDFSERPEALLAAGLPG